MISTQQLASLRARAERTLAEMFPGTITIGAHSYAAAVTQQASQLSPTEQGFEEKRGIVVRVRKVLLSADGVTPRENKTLLTHDGANWRVAQIGGHGDLSPVWILTCTIEP
jgi:hypothetical protein